MFSRKVVIVFAWCVLLVALAIPFFGTAFGDDPPASPNTVDKTKASSIPGSRSPRREVDPEETLKSLSDSDPKVRRGAASDVSRLRGGDAKKAVPALITMLQDDDFSLQEAAANALGKIGPNAKDAVSQLTTALDGDPAVRLVAIVAIGQIGPAAKAAAPALCALLTNTDDHVTLQAALALHALAEQDQACRIALTQLLESKDPRVRQRAAGELGTYRQSAKESIPALLSVLKDQTARGFVREAAVGALGEINPADPEVKDALVAALNDKRRSVQEAAKAALKKIR